MIIIVAGSNGAGKSTAVEAVLSAARHFVKLGEDKAQWYEAVFPDVRGKVVVIGPYFSGKSGGCDALGDVAGCQKLVRRMHAAGMHVLFEGMQMMGHQSAIELYKYSAGDMHVVLLSSDEQLCAQGVLARRVRKGDNEPLTELNKKTIASNLTRARNLASKLAALGCPRTRVDRTLAPETIVRILREAP